MVFELRSSSAADMRELVRAGMRVFANDPPNRAAFAQDPATGEYLPEIIDWMTNSGENDMKNSSVNGKHRIKLVDTEKESESLVACATWIEPRTEEQVKADDERDEKSKEDNKPPASVNLEYLKKVGELRKQALKDVFGTDRVKDFWYLYFLATLPEYERQGAASKLLKWGLDRADAEGKTVFIESTPRAVGFYEKYGCVQKGEMIAVDGYKFHLMVREPQIPN